MPYNATVFRVMIASPSDVTTERNIIRTILADWTAIHSARRQLVLLPVGWESHAAPEMGARPQAIINKQVLRDCDLLIGVFWTRIGTSTGQYASGTVEEIEEHLRAGKPAMLYFSSAPVIPESIDQEQYQKLQQFKNACRERGLIETYDDLNDFREKFARQLQLKLNEDAFFLAASPSEQSDAIPTIATSPIPKLSREATELLVAGAQDPHGNILRLRHIGGVLIQTSNRNFITDNNARTIAIWEGALGELEENGFIRDRGHKGEVYGITREGFDAAELLTK